MVYRIGNDRSSFKRLFVRTSFFITILLTFLAGFVAGQAGTAQVLVRDSRTGEPLRASVTTSSQRHSTNQSGRIEVGLGAGRNELSISATGYRTLSTRIFNDGSAGEITVWLDAVGDALRGSDIPAWKLAPNTELFYGRVFDQDGKALRGASVFVEALGVATTTDSTGYFELSVPVSGDAKSVLPSTVDLVVEAGGAIVHRRAGIFLQAGAVRLMIDAGLEQTVDDANKFKLSSDELGKTQTLEGETFADALIAPAEFSRMSAVVVPASIRVGSNCPTKTTCTTVNVYTLDTYTRLGLDDEWIGSWNTNSLKAGAIAFRTYGAYHVFHPLTATYDICNTTSCQVLDAADSFSATDTATAQTTGTIVVNAAGTDAFFAEYAAENNLGGCPDGFTGNGTSWPCMNDIVDAGQTFNGHGRGMCQWGTQRWATNQGKDFVWITNHYYNDNGNPSGLRTGVLQMGANTILPPPELVGPGTVSGTTGPGATIITPTPTFTWQPVAGADGYALFVSRFNGSTYDLIYDSTISGGPITGTSFTLPAGLLQVGQQYRWNMESHNAGGYGSPNTFRSYFTLRNAVRIAGTVAQTAGGRAISGAMVTISDQTGIVGTIRTSPRGRFWFDGLVPDRAYTITVVAKGYEFDPRVVNVPETVTSLEIIPK